MAEYEDSSELPKDWVVTYPWHNPEGKTLQSSDLTMKLVSFLSRNTADRSETACEKTRAYGEAVRKFRSSLGLSRVDFARQALIHPVALCLLETGSLQSVELTDELITRIEKTKIEQLLFLRNN